jgi:Fur family transcriptional regulator, iron response regulator
MCDRVRFDEQTAANKQPLSTRPTRLRASPFASARATAYIDCQRVPLNAVRSQQFAHVMPIDTNIPRESPSRLSTAEMLAAAGLRPTRQRVALATLLFAGGDRHVNAEMLHEEAARSGVRVSVATVYNTLHQFVHAGLLREISIGGQRTYFDTNTSNHNHFFLEAEGKLVDIPAADIRVVGLPDPPEHLKVSHIDIVVRLVAKRVAARRGT